MKKIMKKIILLTGLIIFAFVSTLGISSEAFFFKHKKQGSAFTGNNAIQQNEGNQILLVEIFASWCPGCKNIQPALDQLAKDLPDIKFIKLDVSTPSKAEVSNKIAKELGLLDFYKVNKNKTATVGIVTPVSKEVVAIFNNENNVDVYKTAIQDARTKGLELQQSPI